MPLIHATDGAHLLGWDPVAGFTIIATFSETVDDIAFAPDGRLWGVRGDEVLTIDPTSGQILSRIDTRFAGGLSGLGFGPDGRAFAPPAIPGGLFEIDFATGTVPNFVRTFPSGQIDLDSLGFSYGDTIVFNGMLWTLAIADVERGTFETIRRLLMGFDLSTGLIRKWVELDAAIPDGFDPEALSGLAIGADGQLYVTGPRMDGAASGVMRIGFGTGNLHGIAIEDLTDTLSVTLVGETTAFPGIRGATGREDGQHAWSLGSDRSEALATWSATATARMFGHGGNDTLTAGALDDELYGGAGNDSLSGLDGSDELYGEDGNDSLLGGAGSDVLQGGLGVDSLSGGEGSDILQDEGLGNDSIAGGAGNDVILAADGNDTAYGEAGADQLQGESGADSLDGGSENDTLAGGTGTDTLAGGSGNDQLAGDQDADQILGGSGNDRGFGGAGNDTLRGEAGIDALWGDAGNDLLVGGAGADTLTGGAGADSFRIEALADYYIAPTPFGPPVLNRFTPDVIADFAPAQADRIDLGALFDSFGATAGALTAAQLRAQGWLRVTQSGTDALVQVDGNGATGGASFLTVAVVQNTQAAALTDLVFLV